MKINCYWLSLSCGKAIQWQWKLESKSELKGKVNVVIVTTVVQGPEDVKDAANKEKYFPYQYVGLKTE